MKSSLRKIAEEFACRDNLQAYTFVFPNQRAGLFFRKYLANSVKKPMFAPSVTSINQCFAELSDLHIADPLTLLLHLYTEYNHLHPYNEGLERFLYWGRMMLTDFSEIDNHMVKHVEALFANVRDWHAIEDKFSYLSVDQKNALARFWKEFEESDLRNRKGDEISTMHRKFLQTWDLLWPLYGALRSVLKNKGLAYEGMLHREVLEHWEELPEERLREKYVFVGFNALTGSERELIEKLLQMGKAEVYFDYDGTFLQDEENKATLFKAENQAISMDSVAASLNEHEEKGQYTLVEVASTVGEVYEVNRILKQIADEGPQDWTRTVVVLPDEQLLIPLLNAIPKEVEKVNVTMGYPLRATSLYLPVAYPEKIFKDDMPTTALAFISKMREHITGMRNEDNSEGVYQLCKVLDRLENALSQYSDISFTVGDVQQLLKMLTLEATIPYVGEPLHGLQVMGVLETRALDFDNVIITDFNDDLYPGRSTGNSFIPYTLRCGFSMPTPDRQNAVFAYNFYRMISYAKRVWFISNSTVDDSHSGEVSRYYYQLKWQYGIDIARKVVQFELTTPEHNAEQVIAKDDTLDTIPSISATMLNTYIKCPKQFYFKYIKKIKEAEPDESISASDMTIGSVLHKIVEQFYEPFLGKMVLGADIDKMLSQVDDESFWSQLQAIGDLGGDMLAQFAVRSYVRNVLSRDRACAPFRYQLAEERLSAQYMGYSLHGYVDRVDLKGNECRVVDYKTGRTDAEYKNMQEVFGVVTSEEENSGYVIRKPGKSQILQTLLYCWLVEETNHGGGVDTKIVPHLYPVRRLLPDTETAVLAADKQPLVFTAEIKKAFLDELQALLQEIYDKEIPYCSTREGRICEYCPFVELCKA